jgi:hypothetical protein
MKSILKITIVLFFAYFLQACRKDNNGSCDAAAERSKIQMNATNSYGQYHTNRIIDVKSAWATYFRDSKQLKIYGGEDNKIEFYFPVDVSLCRFESGSVSYNLHYNNADSTKCKMYFRAYVKDTSYLTNPPITGYTTWMLANTNYCAALNGQPELILPTTGRINLTFSNGLISGDFKVVGLFAAVGVTEGCHADTLSGIIHESALVNAP